MKRTFLLMLAGLYGGGMMMAQSGGSEDRVWFTDREYSTTGVTNEGMAVMFETWNTPYELWNPRTGEQTVIGGVGPGNNVGGAGRFSDDGKTVSARSSMIMRCAMSMVAFGDRLKELSPALKISYESSQKYMPYLTGRSEESNEYTGSKGPWRVEYNKFRKAHTNSARFAAALFNDQEYVAKYVDADELMWEFYWVASDLQNMETEISLYDLFTKDELFDLWQCFNMQFYYGNANSLPSGGKVMNSYKPLLRDIIVRADSAIANPEMAATLRFAHDSNIVPLTALMRINDCAVAIDEPDSLYRYWTDFKISPMCANLQIVFFNKKGGTADDVLVKFILNEHEAKIPVETDNYPYYRWPDVKAYYEKILEE